MGIEVKCKQVKETGGHGGKINLFQQAPRWEEKLSGLERLRLIGQPDEHGHYPWRLTSEDVLSELFSLRVKLR